jgi:hypothetical protein
MAAGCGNSVYSCSTAILLDASRELQRDNRDISSNDGIAILAFEQIRQKSDWFDQACFVDACACCLLCW